jgi:uncharacterized protein HemY
MDIKMVVSAVFALGVPVWLVVEELIHRFGTMPRVKRAAASQRVQKRRRAQADAA